MTRKKNLLKFFQSKFYFSRRQINRLIVRYGSKFYIINFVVHSRRNEIQLKKKVSFLRNVFFIKSCTKKEMLQISVMSWKIWWIKMMALYSLMQAVQFHPMGEMEREKLTWDLFSFLWNGGQQLYNTKKKGRMTTSESLNRNVYARLHRPCMNYLCIFEHFSAN